jgi:hypothetical protein
MPALQDVFELGGKIVILTSTQGLNGWTQFWVGEMSDDDLTFKSGAENPFWSLCILDLELITLLRQARDKHSKTLTQKRADFTDRLDHGASGVSTIYAAKTVREKTAAFSLGSVVI